MIQQLLRGSQRALESQQWGEAEKLLGEILRHPDVSKEDAVASRVNLANCLCEIGGREAEAEGQYKAAFVESPTFECTANYALFLSELEPPRETAAVDMLQKALVLNPQWAQGYYNLANFLAARGAEYEADALASYETAARLTPRDPDVHNNYALTLSSAGQLRKALVHSECAVGLAPHRPDLCLNYAELLGDVGDLGLAICMAERATKLGGSSVALAFALLGALQESTGSAPEEALAALERAWALGRAAPAPISRRWRYGMRLASRYAANSRAKEGLAVYEELVELAHQHAAEFVIGDDQNKVPPYRDEALFLALRGMREEAAALLFAERSTVEQSASTRPMISAACVAAVTDLQLPRPVELASKVALARNLAEAGEAKVAPPTTIVATFQDVAKTVIAARGGQEGPWFLKDPHVQRGQGVTVFKQLVDVKPIMDAVTPKQWVLQRAVHPPALISGRKFGLRLHAFLVHWPPSEHDASSDITGPIAEGLSVYTFRESILTKCANEYSDEDTSPLAQITCTSVQRGQAGYAKHKVKGSASAMWDGYSDAYPGMQEAVLTSVRSSATELLRRDGGANAADGTAMLCCQHFGYDFLVNRAGHPWLIEANMAPQIGDPQTMPELRNTVGIPMINGIVEVLVQRDHSQAQGGGWDWVADLDV